MGAEPPTLNPESQIRRLLIVDDDAHFAAILGERLIEAGYQPIAAQDAAQALTLVESDNLAVALINAELDGNAGIELMGKLREINPGLLCVLLTENAAVDSAMAAVHAGAYDYLRKSPDMSELLAALERCFDRVRLLHEKEQAELALRERERFLRLLLDSTGEGICALDREGRCTLINPAALRMIGYADESDVLGRPLYELFQLSASLQGTPVDDPADWPDEHMGVVERVVYRPDGTSLRVECLVRGIARDGERFGSVLTLVDVTERRSLEDTLHQAQKMEAVGQLAGGIAHDFNNLLTTIFGYTELATEALPPDHVAIKSLERVNEAAEQAAGVTRALLTFSRKTPSNKQTEDLHEVASRAVRLLRRVLPASIEIVLNNAGDSPLFVYADSTQLQQVIMNLAINARDAMPAGGTLTIHTGTEVPAWAAYSEAGTTPTPRATLLVADTGEGMSAAVQNRIFEPFFTTKPSGRGTGLGLSIIHGIVRDHGGTIALDSAPGRGTTFVVTLPQTTTGDSASPTERTARPHRGGGQLILLAEDDRHVREVIAAMLRSLEYEVIQVADGDAVLDALDRFGDRVRLFVADYEMPRRSGLECLRELRSRDLGIPAVIITAAIEPEIEDQVGENAVLLRKPFQLSELGQLVGRLLSGPPFSES